MAHMFGQDGNRNLGVSTGAKATNHAWSLNFLGMSFSGPVRRAAVWAVPVFPPIVTSEDLAFSPVPSVTTAANAS